MTLVFDCWYFRYSIHSIRAAIQTETEKAIGGSHQRVLLVQSYWAPPGQDSTSSPVYPLGLVYLATAISGKHTVRFIDLCVSESPWIELSDAIAEFRPDIVGISIRNADAFGYSDIVSNDHSSISFCLNNLTETLNVISEAGFTGRVVLGGQAFSMFPERIMAHSDLIDFGVFLEGESTFSELLDNLDAPESVKGLYFRRNGETVFTGRREHTDLSRIGSPDRSLMPADTYVKSPEGIGIQSKRGCILSCSYCIYPYLSGSKLRLREPSAVAEEMEELAGRKIDCVHFVDPVFNIPQNHAEDICREIIHRGIKMKWIAWFHPRFLDKEFVRLCEEAGCVKFELSPDAYGQKGLDALKKQMTTEDIRKSLRLARDLSTSTITYNFLINHPGETVLSFLRKLVFCTRVKLVLNRKARIELLNHIRILPGTEVHEQALRDGIIEHDTDMLPVCYADMKPLFYKRSKIVNVFYRLLVSILKIKNKLARNP